MFQPTPYWCMSRGSSDMLIWGVPRQTATNTSVRCCGSRLKQALFRNKHAFAFGTEPDTSSQIADATTSNPGNNWGLCLSSFGVATVAVALPSREPVFDAVETVLRKRYTNTVTLQSSSFTKSSAGRNPAKAVVSSPGSLCGYSDVVSGSSSS